MLKDLSLIGKYRLYLQALLLSAVVLSCSDVQEREEPENLLSKDKMVEIYTDMIFLDAAQRSNRLNFKSYELEPSEHIYTKFKIDSVTLSENIAYYNLDFDANTEIYEQVKQNIVKKNEFIDSITTLRDSLKKIKIKKKRAAMRSDSTQTKKVKPKSP